MKDLLEAEICSFAATSTENTLGMETGEKAFATPLVGFASGSDPLFEEIRDHIGPFYFTPSGLFDATFPDPKPGPGDLTVVVWVLPSTGATRAEQSAAAKQPSERWARTRHFGELFNAALRRHVVDWFGRKGVEAVAPLLSPHWSRSEEGPWAPCSRWSERHAAYVAGLGTFGLCDGFITPVGKAVRVGSVIARMKLPASPRPWPDHRSGCLHFSQNTCRKCVERCPVGALSPEGHDKHRCAEYTEKTMNAYIRSRYGIDTYACGLCQCGVPCMDHVPGPEEG